ncbi:hypothetical protein ACFX2J_029150 [Malus domestica]
MCFLCSLFVVLSLLCGTVWLIYGYFFLLFLLFQFDGFQKEAIQMVKPAKGTTSLAFIFKDGVMVAADSRASMGGYICKLLYNVYPM